MAHELDINSTGQARMAYSSQHGTPWHRLGTAVAGLGTVDEMMTAASLNYKVEISPLSIPDPTNPDRSISVPYQYTWRKHPETGEVHIFGVVGTDYTVIQTRSMLELGLEVAGLATDGEHIDTLGALRDGAQVFCTIPLPDFVLDPDGIGETIARQYSLMTDHTGRGSFKLLRSDTRVVCANTARFAQAAAKWSVSIRHTRSAADIPVAWIKDQLGFLTSGDEQFVALMYSMLGTQGDWSSVATIADKLWKPKDNPTARAIGNRDRRMAKLAEIWDIEEARAGSNGWAVWNTVQGYLQHEQGNTKGRARDERSVAGLQGATFARQCERLTGLVLA